MNKIIVHEDYVFNRYTKKDINIVHISDIHFNKVWKEKNLNKLKECILKNNPDYILITGDTIDAPSITKDKYKIKELLVFLTSLSNQTKVILSIGNHDVQIKEDYKFFKNLNDLNNIYVLNNETYIDELIYISGFTLPQEYYYNIYGDESKDALIEHLKKNSKLVNNLPKHLPKIGMIHSPIMLNDKEVLSILNEYDLLLSGHTHGGMVPTFLDKFFKKNEGIISPRKKLFPSVARGKLVNHIKDKDITLIINGGIMKLSYHSGKILHHMNNVYDMEINKIIITNKKGRY